MLSFSFTALIFIFAVSTVALAPLWRTSRRFFVALLLVVTATTGGLYWHVATPDALDARNIEAPRSLDEAIGQLERRLQREPNEVQGWLLLGRSRAAQENFPLARDAFGKAHALLPDDLDVSVEYADAQLRASTDGRFPDAARVLLEDVISQNSSHQRGLFLLGLQRLQSQRAAEAVALWEQLLPLVESETADALRPQISAARAEAGMPEAAITEQTTAATASPTLNISVSIDPKLAARIPETAVLYVFARSADGAGLPVAVKRLPATQFPLQISLSDNDGLMPTQKLSMQTSVKLLARISFSGDAAGASGDLESPGQIIAVSDGAQASLFIDTIKP